MSGIKQTSLGMAFNRALTQCQQEGRNPGRLARAILTHNAKMGYNGTPAKKQKQQAADSAVIKG
jgi:hypothetical protein